METLAAYIPTDRRQAMAQGLALPQRAHGSVLFADISGFTLLTDAFVKAFGSRRGAEEFPKQLNLVYETLIIEAHRYQGSVVNFSGDALTCWFDQDQGLRAGVCALQMQQVMKQFKEIMVGSGLRVALALKAAITTGPVRRFQIGDPAIQYLDVLAGATVDRVALAEKHAEPGEIIVGSEVVAQLRDQIEIIEWRGKTGTKFAAVAGLRNSAGILPLTGSANDPLDQTLELTEAQVRPWLLTPIYEQRDYDRDQFFLAQIRPAVALFLHFSGIDYDQDEAADAKLDAYIRWVQSVVTRYGGYLIQLTHGDKGSYLYAAFGAPVAHDDDSVRAVAAALDLRLPPRELSFITGTQIGLSRGQIRCGNYGSLSRCTYGVLGDEVIIAARLMGQAQPGQILVSQRVAQAAIHQFEFDYHGSIPLKGKAEYIHVFVTLGQRQTTLPQWVAHFAVPPLGREQELGQLEQLLKTTATGHGQLIRLEGAAGIGKSHLAATLVQRAPHHKVRPVTGRCQSADQHLPYIPWRQILRQLFLLNDLTPVKTQIDQVTQAITAMNPDWVVRLPVLGNLLGLPIPDNPTTQAFEPETRSESLFNFVADLLRAWARELPLLLLIEDAHWLDKMSLTLILKVSQTLSEIPILLLLTHRSFNQSQFTDLNELAGYQQLSLPELTPDNITFLVKTYLKGEILPLALALIQAKAQGNPYFTRELVAELRESGRLVADAEGVWDLAETSFEILRQAGCLARNPVDGQWLLRPEVSLSTADLGLPDSIEGLLLARFDRLSEACRTILKTASVIGLTFEFEVLAQANILLLDQPGLKEQLSLLQEGDFVRQEPQISPPIYAFKHHLVQETIYNSLLSGQQAQLHQAVAEALEKLQPDSIERLADHYRQGQVKAKALIYLDKAAQKMRRESAYEAARRYYDQALSLEERWEWQLGQVEMLHILGQRNEEWAGLKRLEVMGSGGAEEQGGSESFSAAFVVAYLWGQYHEARGEYELAQIAAKRALTSSRTSGNPLMEMRCLNLLGVIARRQGNYSAAQKWYNQAMQFCQGQNIGQIEATQALIETLTGLGSVYRQQGAFDQAQSCYQRALEVSRSSGNKRGEALALDTLGILAYYQGYFAEATAYHQQALELWRIVGDRSGEGGCLSSLAHTACDSGNFGLGEKYLSEALKLQQETGNRWEQLNIWIDWGGLHYELGELAQAKSSLERGLQLSQDIGDESGEAYVLCNLGLVLGEIGQLIAAEAALRRGLALAEYQADEDLASSFYFYLSLISWQAGAWAQAIEASQTALTLRQKLGLHLRMADDLATLAAAHLAMGQLAEALAMIEPALGILAECGGEGPEFPQRVYFVGYQVLTAAGQKDQAQAALQSAYNLVMARANSITDPIRRRSFLESRALSREIVTEYWCAISKI